MSIKGIIAGLGNPGGQYEKTRHNIGFMVINKLITITSASKLSGKKFYCDLWKTTTIIDNYLLAKPQTYMNLSGEAIHPLVEWYNITKDNLLVIHDELDLPIGKMKLQQGGGTAGHNGLKSIIHNLGTKDFYRLRIGIGRSSLPSENTVNWVLGHLSMKELTTLNHLFPTIFDALSFFIKDEKEKAIRMINSFTLSETVNLS